MNSRLKGCGNGSLAIEQTQVRHRWRFAVVLIASLLLTVAQPLLSELLEEGTSFDVFFSLLIAAVLLLVFDEPKQRKTAVFLGIAAFSAVWASHALGDAAGRWLLVAAYLLAVSFFAFTLYGILRATFAKQASGDAIFGAVCGYVLLGVIWSLIYIALETAFPGSFNFPVWASSDAHIVKAHRSTLGYFSFITLATVGYGDVTPATPLARTLAWIEAVAGQFYLAVLVAGLVGFKVTQALRDGSDDKQQHS